MNVYLVDSMEIVNDNEIRSYCGVYDSKRKAAEEIRELITRVIETKKVEKVFVMGLVFLDCIPPIDILEEEGYIQYKAVDGDEGCFSITEFEVM